MSVANSVEFAHVVVFLNGLEGLARGRRKTEMIESFFQHLVRLGGPRSNHYPVLRLLIPQEDSDRATYGIRESSLSAHLVRVLALDDSRGAGARLKHWKKRVAGRGGGGPDGAVGDLPTVVYEVVRARESGADKHATVGEVNDLLDELVACGRGCEEPVVRKMVSRLTARELYWVCRVIFRDMKIGAGKDTILRAYHPRAPEWNRECAGLAALCERAASPDEYAGGAGGDSAGGDGAAPAGKAAGGDGSGIRLFSMFQPMVAAPPGSYLEIIPSFGGRPCVVEPKFDGERMLLHARRAPGGGGLEVRLFSRKRKELTDVWNYGDCMLPLARASIAPDVEDCIIDGEWLAWDGEARTFCRFGANRTVAIDQARGRATTQRMCFVAFDMVWCNGKNLTSWPLRERRAALERAVPPGLRRPHEFDLAEQRAVASTPEMMEELDRALRAGLEGLVVKDLESTYHLGRSRAFMKLKPDYVEGMLADLDVVIVAGYYGEGRRRAGGVSSFAFAVVDTRGGAPQSGRHPERFLVAGKVGTGYSTSALADMQRVLGANGHVVRDRQLPPEWVDAMGGWKPQADDMPDVVYHPSESIVLEVHSGEVCECAPEKFNAGFTLRFPRVARIRSDKEWYDIATIDDVRGAFAKRSHASAASDVARRDHASGRGDGARKKRGRGGGGGGGSSQGGAKRAKVEDVVAVEYDLLGGREFCVMCVDGEREKAELERRVKRLGGAVAQHPGAETYCVLYGQRKTNVAVVVEQGRTNVLHHRWLQACEEQRQLLPLTGGDGLGPYALHVTEEVREALRAEVDQYGDHFWQPATRESLRSAMAQAAPDAAEARERRAAGAVARGEDADGAEAARLKKYEALLPRESRVFRGCRVYLDRSRELQTGRRERDHLRIPAHPLVIAATQVASCGGVVERTLHEPRRITHAVVYHGDAGRVPELRRLLPHAHVVESDWVARSHAAVERQPEAYYDPDLVRKRRAKLKRRRVRARGGGASSGAGSGAGSGSGAGASASGGTPSLPSQSR